MALYPGCRLLKDSLKTFSDIAARVLFPAKCMSCGAFIPRIQDPDPGRGLPDQSWHEGTGGIPALFDRVMKPFLCPVCLGEFTPITSPICTRCGKMFKSREGEDRICGECGDEHSKRKINRIRSVGVYQTVFSDLVCALKYNGKIQLAGPLGSLLAATFRSTWHPGSIDMILSVPLHKKRARERGFNQSWLMVKSWPVHVVDDGAVVPDAKVMVRSRPTLPQMGLSKNEREKNIKGAFAVLCPEALRAKRILLVDDVYTTGSTLNECAGRLLDAGAASVDALTLARAL